MTHNYIPQVPDYYSPPEDYQVPDDYHSYWEEQHQKLKEEQDEY